MILYVVIFFCLYTLAMGIVISIGYVLQRSKEREYETQESKVDVDDMVVLIPFRNEEHRIGELLDSMRSLTRHPSEYVFIDDHSDDQSVRLIEESMEGMSYRIISLSDEVTGKKRALRFATEQTTSQYILTIDADVVLAPDYFEKLANYGEGDMYIMAAILKPKSILQHFYEIDAVLVTAANAGLAGLKRPIMASGANLLYKRDTFTKVDDIESHIHAASGDDTYLLRDFRLNNADVRLLSDPSCAVVTETPQSFREFIDQRLRWIGKTGDIKDNLSTSLAVLQAVLTIIFFGLIVASLIQGELKLFLLIFGLKAFTDMVLFFPYFNRIKRLASWVFIPIYEFLFPLYTLLLSVLLLTYKPEWKGRAIYQK